MNTAIAQHLNVPAAAILEVQEWARVLWVRVKGLGARFVSKKVVIMKDVTLPELKGSEKQIKWAQEIRQSLLDAIKGQEQSADWDINGRCDETGKMTLLPVAAEKHDGIKASLAFRKEWLAVNVLNQADAKFWIDNRSKNWMAEARKAFRNA
jgi:hypothetical protein